MDIMDINKDADCLEIAELVNRFYQRYLERAQRVQQRVSASKKDNVLQTKIAQAKKTNADLKAQLAEMSKQSDDIGRICAKFTAGVTISDGDQQRLENAKEVVEVAKKLTGIRFDYSAPPDVVKGYIKDERTRSLTPFSLPADSDENALWSVLEEVTLNKENIDNN